MIADASTVPLPKLPLWPVASKLALTSLSWGLAWPVVSRSPHQRHHRDPDRCAQQALAPSGLPVAIRGRSPGHRRRAGRGARPEARRPARRHPSPVRSTEELASHGCHTGAARFGVDSHMLPRDLLMAIVLLLTRTPRSEPLGVHMGSLLSRYW
jgi:hypothetical protein